MTLKASCKKCHYLIFRKVSKNLENKKISRGTESRNSPSAASKEQPGLGDRYYQLLEVHHPMLVGLLRLSINRFSSRSNYYGASGYIILG
jgi:hypothetical protein